MEGLRTEPESSGSWGAAAARDGDAEALLIDMLPLVTVLKGADASFQLDNDDKLAAIKDLDADDQTVIAASMDVYD
ncbi:hypothetical protein SprV_0200627000 [Sparganum proliferum]